MAKSDSFFIRASVEGGAGFTQTEIDLGAYVDALGKSVLRIHNIAVQQYETGLGEDFSLPANSQANIVYQLTTQSQATAVDADDKSVIASGKLIVINNSGTANFATFVSHDADVLPQMWTNGYLVATENIFLGMDVEAQLGTCTTNVVLECTVETMSQNAAMALALSQQ